MAAVFSSILICCRSLLSHLLCTACDETNEFPTRQTYTSTSVTMHRIEKKKKKKTDIELKLTQASIGNFIRMQQLHSTIDGTHSPVLVYMRTPSDSMDPNLIFYLHFPLPCSIGMRHQFNLFPIQTAIMSHHSVQNSVSSRQFCIHFHTFNLIYLLFSSFR